MRRILVIKHGALGDIVLAFPAFAAIRAAHPGVLITVLTRKPFAALLAACPWFDAVEIDAGPKFWQLRGVLDLRRRLRGYDMVYDLQNSGRSNRYFTLAGKPPWSGIAPGCAFPHADKARMAMHTRERTAAQLAAAGISALPVPDLSWADADISRLGLPEGFTVLVPGAAPHRPAKRWPAAYFAALAGQVETPIVIIGGPDDIPLAATIKAAMPDAIDLTGKTTLLELAAVIRRAKRAIGNDTGPMHLAAALGVSCVVLFSSESDPDVTAPRYPDGGWPVVLRAAHLRDLPVAQVVCSLP